MYLGSLKGCFRNCKNYHFLGSETNIIIFKEMANNNKTKVIIRGFLLNNPALNILDNKTLETKILMCPKNLLGVPKKS